MNEVDAIIQVWPRPLSPTETQWLRKEAAALIANQQRTKPTPTTSVSQVIVDQNYVDMYEYLVSLSAAIKQLSQNHQKITQQLENFAKEIDKSTRDLRRYLSRGE